MKVRSDLRRKPDTCCRICRTWSEWLCWFSQRTDRPRTLACTLREPILAPFSQINHNAMCTSDLWNASLCKWINSIVSIIRFCFSLFSNLTKKEKHCERKNTEEIKLIMMGVCWCYLLFLVIITISKTDL